MILETITMSWGPRALEARVRAAFTFQNGWFDSILALWNEVEDDRFILMAADVLEGLGNPEQLRLDAAPALYYMRQESMGTTFFPMRAWKVLSRASTESQWGQLHHAVLDVLKLQGARNQ